MRKSISLALGLGVGLVVMTGCNREGRNRPLTPEERANRAEARAERAEHRAEARTEQVSAATTREMRSAVRSIADARCDREARCHNIGVDAKFASRAACVERVRADWADDLNAHECPKGVRDHELDECLHDIRDEECGNPFDSLDRMFSCGTSEICNG